MHRIKASGSIMVLASSQPGRGACPRSRPPGREDLSQSCNGLSRARAKSASGYRQPRCSPKAQNRVGLVLQNKRAPPRAAGLLSSKPVVRSAYFGALESVLLLAALCFLLWCLDLWVDLAGADAEVSVDGAAVSAAMTGPAASSSRLTTGTSFLNIDRLHCKEKLSGFLRSASVRPASKRAYYDWIVRARFQDDRNVMLPTRSRAALIYGLDQWPGNATSVRTGTSSSASRREPPRSGRSMMKQAASTSAPRERSSLTAAVAVPPVAMRSSTRTIFSPRATPSWWISISSPPYSSE